MTEVAITHCALVRGSRTNSSTIIHIYIELKPFYNRYIVMLPIYG